MRLRARSIRWTSAMSIALAAALVALTPALSPVRSEEPPDKKEKAEEPETTVFTNDDLERMFGPPAPRPQPGDAAQAAEEGGEEGGDKALKALNDEVAREKTRRLRRAEAEERVRQAERRVGELESRLLRIRNPLLKPPQADMTPEELAEWDGLSNPERLERTNELLAAARDELEQAEKSLKKLTSPPRH